MVEKAKGVVSRVAARKLKKQQEKAAKEGGRLPELTKKLRGFSGITVDKVMHCAIRQLANQQQKYRKAAVFGNASAPEVRRSDLCASPPPSPLPPLPPPPATMTVLQHSSLPCCRVC